MSKAVMKRCDNCGGTGWSRGFICGPCDGSGRVPDVEATQRAQLDAARIMCERFDSQLRTKESENAELRAQLSAALADADERRAVAADSANLAQSFGKRLEVARAEVRMLTDDNARLTAEVERLKGRDNAAAPLLRLVLDTAHMGDEWERDAEAWLAGCKP